jgi:hypothetical protein
MRILLRTLVGVCLVLTIATVGVDPAPPSSGRLDLHWSGATFWQAYRLKGRYTLWGLSDGSVSTLSSPVDGVTSSLDLAPGLYSLQLEPGACMYFDHDLHALAALERNPMDEACREARAAMTWVLVESGRQRDVELSLADLRPETLGGGAEVY